MPSIYSGPSSSSRKKGGSVYAGPRRKGRGETTSRLSPAQREWAQDYVRKNSGMSLFGAIGNAAKTGAAMVSGIPAAAQTGISDLTKLGSDLAPDTSRFAERYHKKRPPKDYQIPRMIAEDYAYRWGPLNPLDFHPGRWARRNYETGFLPFLLDVTGAASVANKGLVATTAVRSAPRSVVVRLPDGSGVERAITGSELSRNLKIGARRALYRLPKGVGQALEQAAGAKALRRQGELGLMRNELKIAPYLKAQERLDLSLPIRGMRGRNKQTIAVNAIRNFGTRAHFETYIDTLRAHPDNARIVSMYSDPKVLNWVENPTKKMLDALDEGDVMTTTVREPILADKISPEGLRQRTWQPLLLLHGAEMKRVALGGVDSEIGATVMGADGRVGRLVRHNEDGTATVRYGRTTPSGKKQSWSAEVPLAELTRESKWELTPAPGKTIEQMIDEIAPSLPEGRQPRYAPHMDVPEHPPAGMGTGGRVPPANTVKQNRGFLQEAGRLALNIDSLGIRTLQLLRYALYSDKHDLLVQGAREVEKLPKGWEYVKQKRGEKIGHMEQTAGDFEQMLDNIDVDDPGVSKLGDEFTTTRLDEAMVGEGGGRLAVPKSYANRLIGEFSRNNDVISRFARNTTDVWRALVLNLRVGWLVNNLVGNTLLYAIRINGIRGITAYFNEFGAGDARFSREFIEDVLPDQAAGTFYGTQVPTAGAVSKTLGHRYAPTRVLRDIDKGYEQKLRRARSNEMLASNPAVKRHYEAMPKQTRSWEAAARKAIAEDSNIPNHISQQVNDALGDFLRMSDFERKWLRGVVPFYGWFQAITMVVGKMPLDAPGRTLVLANLGRAGLEVRDDYWRSQGIDPERLPWHIRTAIPFAGGMLRTAGLNPLATLIQLGSGLAQPGQARQILDSLNPVLFAGLLGAAREANKAGWEDPGSFLGGALGAYGEEARFLPESRLAVPYDSALYAGPHPRIREAAQYAGFPWAKYDMNELRRRYGFEN